ncbi:peroxiredoxin family protein [Niabella aquatica]
MRIVKLLILLLVISAIGILLYKIINRVNSKTAAEQRTAILPAFTFYTLSNTPFTNDSLIKVKGTVIIYFNTGCEHCQYETEQVVKYANKLQQADFLMVSHQPVSELKVFDSIYSIAACSFIKLLHDREYTMQRVFGANTVPTIFIYNKDNRFIKKYSGEVKIDAIIDAIK